MKLTESQVVEQVDEVSVRRLRIWVREGWIAPAEGETGPIFDALDVARVRLVCQLKNELELHDDAVPVVLSLIDQVHGLRNELKALAEAVDQLPEDARRRVRDAFCGPAKS